MCSSLCTIPAAAAVVVVVAEPRPVLHGQETALHGKNTQA